MQHIDDLDASYVMTDEVSAAAAAAAITPRLMWRSWDF